MFPSETAFLAALSNEMAANRFNRLERNYDTASLGDEPPVRDPPMALQLARDFFGGIWASGRRIYEFYFKPTEFFRSDAEGFKDVAFLHNLAGNQKSKDLVVKLCAYRSQGYRRTMLPRNTAQYWQDMEAMSGLQTDEPPIKIAFMDATLALNDCSSIGYDMKVYATGPGLACALVQKQYEYYDPDKAVVCKAEDGDIVVEAGGCWGETTVYFAHEAGPEGRVVTFEFIPSNLAVLDANLRANPTLAPRITVVPQPVWKSTGLKLYYVDWGPGSRVTTDEDEYQYDGVVTTTTIDHMVFEQDLPRVDFIKMDIEGAELSALKGAEDTIRRFTPKLAISLYHNISDFTTIPMFLYSLGLEYDFFVDHHTIYQNETVLFAVPNKRRIAAKMGISYEAFMEAGGRPPESSGTRSRPHLDSPPR